MDSKDTQIQQTKRKAARVQLNPSLVAENSKPDQSGDVFNIWYSKWTGGETNGKQAITHSKHKCNVQNDSGYTKADRYIEQGTINRSHHFCLYFARGYCCNGKNCEYLHRIPTELDIFSPTVDCFGRERFSDYRDDMSGVGSFSRVNKTLYVGNIVKVDDKIEERIKSSFGDFGSITNISVIKSKNIAFVTYKLENQAQFAKEAMYRQSLDLNDKVETLNIKWANDDPSFRSKKRELEEDSEMSVDAARKLLDTLRKQNMSNKKQKSDTKESKLNYNVNIQEQANHKVGLDINAIRRLAELRSTQKLKFTSLVSGYTSDEDSLEV